MQERNRRLAAACGEWKQHVTEMWPVVQDALTQRIRGFACMRYINPRSID